MTIIESKWCSPAPELLTAGRLVFVDALFPFLSKFLLVFVETVSLSLAEV